MVLFPGLVLPLHVFEERYRALVRELLALPEEERVFGVVAIRLGREVGEDGVTALHEMGCTARLRQSEEHEDGRFDIVTTGTERFVLEALVDDDRPYLVGQVELVEDELGDAQEAALLDAVVRSAYVAYLTALSEAGAGELEAPELPDDPLVLSYLVAATVVLDLDDRQALLAESDGISRLRAELSLLRREVRLLGALGSAPAPELARTAAHPN
ncbi:MAG: putative Endopeptidase [Frankiales bacterium]|jgi:Lon protease-like protein|nr:putative Endopeptidase [Frankiales bacterium]